MEENNQQPVAPTPPVAPSVAPPSAPPVAPPTATPPPVGGGQSIQPQPVNKGLVIGIIVAVVVFMLLIGGVLFAIMRGSDKSGSDTKESSLSSESADTDESSNASGAPSSANAVTAKYSSDFDAVCEKGSVSNASALQKPYKVAVFSRTSAQVRNSWSEVSLDYDSPHRADYDTPTEISVVGCLDEKKGTAVKTTTCEFDSRGEKTTLDYYAVQYELVFKEAKTGKELKKAGLINGPATDCPSFVTYNKSDPKLYAKPDKNAVDAAVAAFAQ